LRQQADRGPDTANRSLADFVAPMETALADHVGAFAVTAGLGCDELVKRYEAEHDDYRAILVEALADRLAEACAEGLHRRVRRRATSTSAGSGRIRSRTTPGVWERAWPRPSDGSVRTWPTTPTDPGSSPSRRGSPS